MCVIVTGRIVTDCKGESTSSGSGGAIGIRPGDRHMCIGGHAVCVFGQLCFNKSRAAFFSHGPRRCEARVCVCGCVCVLGEGHTGEEGTLRQRRRGEELALSDERSCGVLLGGGGR